MGGNNKGSKLDTQSPLVDDFMKALAVSTTDLKQTQEAWLKCPDKDRSQFIEKLMDNKETDPAAKTATVAFIKGVVAEGLGKGLSDPSLQANMFKYLKENNASADTPAELAATRVLLNMKPGR